MLGRYAVADVTATEVLEHRSEALRIREAVDRELQRVRELVLLGGEVVREERANRGGRGEEALVEPRGEGTHAAREASKRRRHREPLRLDLHRRDRARCRKEDGSYFLERFRELDRGREAFRRLAPQAAFDDRRERLRHVGPCDAEGRQVGVDDRERHRLAFEMSMRELADEQLIQDEPECPHVGARRGGLGPPELGREICRRSHDRPGPREGAVLRGRRARCDRRRGPSTLRGTVSARRLGGVVGLVLLLLAPSKLGEPEVEQLDLAAVAEHDVARLDVAMEDPLAVRSLEPCGEPARETEGRLPGNGPRDPVETLAADELVGDVGVVRDLADAIHANHVWMGQLRDGAGLHHEPPACGGGRVRRGDELERYLAVEAGIPREVDVAHAATSEHALDDELVEGCRGSLPLDRAGFGGLRRMGHSRPY